MSIKLVAGPVGYPVTVEAAKKWLRVDHDEDNGLIEEAVASATRKLDGYSGVLGRCLMRQTWRLALARGWDRDCRRSFPIIRLPLTPILSASVTLIGVDGSTTAVSSLDAVLDEDALGFYVRPRIGSDFAASIYAVSRIDIDMVAGYGSNPSDVPADIRSAIKLDIEREYDRPGKERFDAITAQYDEIVRRNQRIVI